MKTLILAATLAAFPLSVLAQAGSDITVTDAYVRSANPRSGAAFMTIANAGAQDCQLTAVASDLTGRAELHTHVEENGVMKMTSVQAVTIPANGTAALERGGDHVMLMALETPLQQGDEVTLTLDLGDCGTVPVKAAVDNDRGKGEAMDHAGHDDHAGHGDHAGHDDHAGHGAPASHDAHAGHGALTN